MLSVHWPVDVGSFVCFWLASARPGFEETFCRFICHRWGLAPVALRGLGGEVLVNTLCPASHVDGLP